jgi:hypothetical protein
MNESELTPWFPPAVRPAHAGIYETRWPEPGWRPDHPQYQHWNGRVWSAWAYRPDIAERNTGQVSARQDPEWRGLAKEPK